MRESGILMPIFSLPGKYGIGCFSKEAYKFVDFLKASGQRYWQILPLGPTGYGDSPYQSFSTFAGNPYFISLDALVQKKLLKRSECKELETATENGVDYGFLYEHKYTILRKAYKRWKFEEDAAFGRFYDENRFWLEDYALFMALKNRFGGVSFTEWEKPIRLRDPQLLEQYRQELGEDVLFYEFLQYEFTTQWFELKKYANDNGIKIIGDIPIYVAPDSSDFWAAPELFEIDEDFMPSLVAGCPPDGFSDDGQLWGNPVYNWEAHRRTGYEWWISRIRKCRELYDVIRIDHFRGFDEFYTIDAKERKVPDGHWMQGAGIELFRAIENALGKLPIIAEDLGYITDSVKQLVKDTGFPNMKVLEFAFDSRDSSGAALYLPHNYESNCVVYTGTHDNETLLGWLSSITADERKALLEYMDGDASMSKEQIVERMIKLAEGSVAETCIIPMQDWLGLDNTARINQPSTTGANWKWRLADGALTKSLSKRILSVSKTYGRA